MVSLQADALCTALRSSLEALYACEPHDEAVRVRTPFLYPDGDVIDVFVRSQGDRLSVSDLGETLRWLFMQSTSPRRTTKQQALIDAAASTHGVELFRGMVMARAKDEAHLADAVHRVAQASLRISDLWFTFRTRTVQSTTAEVADFLTDRKVAFEQSQKFSGRSGRTWSVDFHTRTPTRSALVSVLTTGNRSAAKQLTDRTVAAWHDLSHLKAGREPLSFVSLIDDTNDVWQDEDYRLVGDLSEVALWSRPEEFAELLEAA